MVKTLNDSLIRNFFFKSYKVEKGNDVNELKEEQLYNNDKKGQLYSIEIKQNKINNLSNNINIISKENNISKKPKKVSNKYLIVKKLNEKFILLKNILFYLICLLFLKNFFVPIKSQKNKTIKKRILGDASIISLIIERNGVQKVLNTNKNFTQVLINGHEVDMDSGYFLNLNEDINNVTIIFEDSFIDCQELFANLNNIKEIDLSNFDIYYIQNMKNMFANCTNLEKVTFNEYTYTPELYNLEGLFYGCNSLKSVDLSMFGVNQVLSKKEIFYNCSSLIKLNLSQFFAEQVNNKEGMFKGCTKLKYVDISNFDTSEVSSVIMSNLFDGCNSLAYVNLSNFVAKTTDITDEIFKEVPNNLIYCFQGGNSIFINQLSEKKCSMNLCLNDWRKYQQKDFLDKDICVNDCASDDNNKLSYNNRCFQSCPPDTHISIIDDENMCVIDCPVNFPYEKDYECSDICSPRFFK